MGIKEHIVKAAGKAGDAVAKASSLSPEQLSRVQEKRDFFLSQMPDPSDPAAVELTQRLIGACGVEIYNAYLPQINELYAPVDPTAEYGSSFDSDHNIRFLNITKWVVDPHEDSLEKLVNVYGVLSDNACNIALVFNRKRERTDVFLAIMDEGNTPNNVNVESYKKRIAEALKGNFPGSEIGDGGSGRIPCLNGSEDFSVATVSNIPAEKSERFISQTVEKLLDGIVPARKSEEYILILLATPIHDVEKRKLRLAELYTALAPYAGWQTNFTLTESDSTMAMATVGINAGVSAGTQQGTNASVAGSESSTDSSSLGGTYTTSEGDTSTDGSFKSIAGGVSLSEEVKPLGVGASATESLSATGGTSTSASHATSTAKAVARTLGKAATKGMTKTAGAFQSMSLGANFGASFSRASSITATIGKNEGIVQSFTNYAIKHALETLEKQMKRLEQASALGMWDFAAYVLSEDPDVASNVAHSYLSLTQGDESYMSHSAVNLWRGDLVEGNERARAISAYLCDLRHPLFGLEPALLDADSSFATYPAAVNATTALSGKELAYSLNFPRKSISGLPVIECASFGRNITSFDSSKKEEGVGIKLGNIFHMHHVEPSPVILDKDSLSSHCFVTGSTGAGKTNTVCRILDETKKQGVGFLVIEPAKGEYKDIFGGAEDVNVFGTNPRLTPLLKINPFSFHPDIHILEHLDRLVEVFNVCWPMYAAMPAVLKSAIERSYVDCGWDLSLSENDLGEDLYPDFADVARNVREILDSSEYDAENKGAYKGSLITRLESLTNGINGMILSNVEIDPSELFDGNTIVDLSRVGSSETKSLIMGLLVLKLQEHRMTTSKGANLPLKHITVLEEAHNLLKRTSTEQPTEGGNLLGKSVEMLSNAIAEMRTYGEGFIIADQAPGLLDMAAIRNTNTKVIMRLPDLSDRELVGKAAALNDAQIAELSKLPMGVAAVYQNDWIEPVLCRVERADDETGYVYVPTDRKPKRANPLRALEIADVLAKSETVDSPRMDDLKAAVRSMDISCSIQAAIIWALGNPPKEPRMTKLAPLVSALFPDVKKSVEHSFSISKETTDWTDAAEAALRDTFGAEIEESTRRVIVQGVITEYLFNELHDTNAFKDWYQRSGMR